MHSPGGLGGRVPACGCRLDNLLEQRWSRNATLVQGLVAMDIIEELGFGLDRMVAAMGAAGLPAPGFREVGDTFVVTLRGPGTQLFGPAPAPDPGPEAARPRASPRLQARRTRQAWALDRMRTAGPLGVRAYAAARAVSADTALRDLQDLVAGGQVEARGTTSDRLYALRHDAG